jgi:L-aspartate oxidase
LEALHLCRTAILIAEGALNRRESRGVHYREDYPAIDNDKWKKHIRFQKDAGMTLGE